MTCEATGDCRLQDLAYEYGVKGERFAGGKQHHYAIDDPNPFIQVDRNKCILCRRCVRACNYINGIEALGIVYRGFNAKIAFGMDSTMEDSPCEFCGSCVEVCPVGALWPKMSLGKGRPWQLKQVQTICSYCGVGCQLTLHVRDNQIVKVTGADGPANHGFTCVKGRFGYDYVNHPERLSKPLVRRHLISDFGFRIPDSDGGNGHPQSAIPLRGTQAVRNPQSDFVEVSWDIALDLVTKKLVETKRAYGSDAFAMLCSARCTNEENYLAMKLTRQVMQTHNIDHCARL
jgi:predicted molibdopterin-dependent oxidoreductase YjgC